MGAATATAWSGQGREMPTRAHAHPVAEGRVWQNQGIGSLVFLLHCLHCILLWLRAQRDVCGCGAENSRLVGSLFFLYGGAQDLSSTLLLCVDRDPASQPSMLAGMYGWPRYAH